MPLPQKQKEIAYALDPECWKSYSGKSKNFKQYMDGRRSASLNKAFEELKKLHHNEAPTMSLRDVDTGAEVRLTRAQVRGFLPTMQAFADEED